MNKSLFFALIILTFFNAELQAREIIYGKGKVMLPTSFGVETLLRFPLEVKNITEANRFEIRPANSDEPDYSVLVVKPRMSEGSSDVTFILSDGSVIRTTLLISNRTGLKKDSIYDFKPKDPLLETNPNLPEKRDPMVVSELDLMRAMIKGDQISGFNISRTSQSVPLGESDLTASLVKVYSGQDVNGYIYELKESAGSRRYKIDLKELTIGSPNLAVLAQVDNTTLGGRNEAERKTYLRVVARPGASSRRMLLPVEIERKPSGTRKEDR